MFYKAQNTAQAKTHQFMGTIYAHAHIEVWQDFKRKRKADFYTCKYTCGVSLNS